MLAWRSRSAGAARLDRRDALFAPSLLVAPDEGGRELQSLDAPARAGAHVLLVVDARYPHRLPIGPRQRHQHVPIACGAIARQLDDRVGDAMESEGRHLV